MPFGISTFYVHCFLIALSIGGLPLLFYSNTISNVVHADSPSFGQQEIKNTPENWKVRSLNGEWIPAADGSSNTDILAINYFSDGQFLNTTLWLNGPVGSPPTNDNDRAYGMLIDADSNNKTGWQGIDYQVEINGQNGVWNKTVQQWSSTGETRVLSNSSVDKSLVPAAKNYVLLDVDLKKYLLYPHKYKVLFYAEEKHEQNPRIIDFSNWVAIPPPNFIVTISPNPLVIREGQQQQDNASAIVQINSTTGRESEVALESYFENNHYINFEPSHMHIPSYGMGTSIVTITNSKSLRQGEIPIPIIINSSLLPEGIDVGNSINQLPSKSSVNNIMIPKYIPTENVIEQSYLIVKVVKPPPFSEQLKNWINDWFNPFAGIITPIVSAVSGILGWKIGSSKNKDKENTIDKKTKEDENP